MPEKWAPVPLDAPLWLNGDERLGKRVMVALENCYQNDSGGISRWWGLRTWATLPDKGRVYLNEWRGNLLAATSNGQVFRTGVRTPSVERVTGVLVAGGGRVIFQPTDDDMLMAAGAAIVAFDGRATRKLSDDAPSATHVGFIDGYALANEAGSARFFNAGVGTPRTWDPIDVMIADAQTDDISAILVSPFREILVFGPKSLEQWERTRSTDTPFFRRYATPASLIEPYAAVFADNATFAFVHPGEVARISGQSAAVVSTTIGQYLSRLDDTKDAWIGGAPDMPFEFDGQSFIILQFPRATNRYGTKGVTLAYNFRRKKWNELYGFDTRTGLPTRWPGWSHWNIQVDGQMRTFVGGDGVIYEVVRDSWWHDSTPLPMRVRTGHYMDGQIRIDDMLLKVKRGVGPMNGLPPKFRFRCQRDNRTYTRWIERTLGDAAKTDMEAYLGAMGTAASWQFDMEVSGNCDVQVRSLEMKSVRVGW